MGGRRKLLLRFGGRWWLLRCTRAEVDEAVAAACRATLVTLVLSPGGYEIRTRDYSLRLTLSSMGSAFQLGFPGTWRAVPKAKLVKRLLAKQFEPFVPRPRVRLRRTRAQ